MDMVVFTTILHTSSPSQEIKNWSDRNVLDRPQVTGDDNAMSKSNQDRLKRKHTDTTI